MEDIRPCRILISEIPSTDPKVGALTYKPYGSIIACLVIGVVMIITQMLWVMGVIIIPIALFALIKLPDRKVIEIFDQYVVIYTAKDETYCQLVRWDEMDEWALRAGKTSGDLMTVRLKSGEYLTIESYHSVKLIKYFNKYVPHLEAGQKMRDSIEKKPSRFKWPWKKKNKGE